MFGVKKQLKAYLDVIRPWAMGVNNRGWTRSDFQVFVSGAALGNPDSWHDREDVKASRTDPSHVIFPIRPYELTFLDRLFLNQEQVAAVFQLNQVIGNFNAALDAANRASDIDTKWGRMILLHAGTIGTYNTGGLFDAFRNADGAL